VPLTLYIAYWAILFGLVTRASDAPAKPPRLVLIKKDDRP
jgi:hypothetical protein